MESNQNSPSSQGPLLLLSDLDDTIKISNTTSKLVTVYRGLFRTSAFIGMAQLYEELLSSHPGSDFHIVSSSPPAIRKKIEKFLALNKFPAAKLTLRDWLRQTSVQGYKRAAILELIQNSKCPVILIGDDTEHDPEVFAAAASAFPEKVAARYLRAVRGRKLPAGSTEFFTAFDIACCELSAGRLSSANVLRVGEAVLQGDKNSRLIPWFSLKPPINFMPLLTNPDAAVLELWKKVQQKVQAIPRRKTKP
jgi:hypothetical protein